MEGEQRAQVAFGTEALVTTLLRSPAPSGLCHPPAWFSPFPLAILRASPSQAGCAVGSEVSSGFSEVRLVGGRGVEGPGELWAPSLGDLVYSRACLVPWLLVPVAYM